MSEEDYSEFQEMLEKERLEKWPWDERDPYIKMNAAEAMAVHRWLALMLRDADDEAEHVIGGMPVIDDDEVTDNAEYLKFLSKLRTWISGNMTQLTRTMEEMNLAWRIGFTRKPHVETPRLGERPRHHKHRQAIARAKKKTKAN